MNSQPRIVLTGFMGVGKSTVARCLAHILQAERFDLDRFIEANENRSIAEIIENEGEARFRELETASLREIFTATSVPIVSLGGGTWISETNRSLIKSYGCTTVWLESTFDHCWRNISISKQNRPLARNRKLAEHLFEERQKFYCLADWHFIVKPQLTSFDVARLIAEEILD